MDEVKVIYHEVYVLTKDGWTLHARYPSDEQRVALTEAKAAEARLAAATKVVRSEYYPRSNHEVRKDIYTSRLAAGEADLPMPAPRRRRPAPAAPQRAPERARAPEPRSAGAVLFQVVGITGMAALIAGLATAVVGGVLGEQLSLLVGAREGTLRGLLYGTFLVVFLLIAVPRILAVARSIGDIRFGFERRSRPPAAKPPRPVPAPPPPPAAAPELDTIDRLVMPLPDDDPADGDAPAAPEPTPEPAGESGNAPAAPEPPRSPASRRRLEAARRPLMRFLGRVVAGLREARPHLDSYERFGLGLLVVGAGHALAESARLEEDERRALLAEAMGVLGSGGARAEAMLDELEAQADEPRAARMIQAGLTAMRQFAHGGQDFLAAVLTALESWTRPTGATGTGVVSALVIEAWPLDDALGRTIREAAQAHGGAVLGMADGVVLLFPGAVRAVEVALSLREHLPAASRMGLDATEAASEEEAVRCVATARAACQQADPGVILVTLTVRGLCSRTPLRFSNVPAAGALELAAVDRAEAPAQADMAGTEAAPAHTP